jgi:hypothetical protein
MQTTRWLPLSGAVFVILAVVAVVALGGDTPQTDDSAAKINAFYDDQSWRQGIAAFVFSASIPFLVIFAATLASVLSPGSGSQSIWRHVLIGGGVLTGATVALSSLFHFALVDAADNHVSPTALQALNVLDANTWVAFNPGLGVFMIGAAGCLLTLSADRRWPGWLALFLGIVLFIPFADFFALIATLLWIIVMSIIVFRRQQRAVAPAAPAP